MDDPRVGTVLDERYRIHQRLAAGGMGVVYRGERVGLAKPVAIKFLHRSSALVPERLERFRREAAAMSRLAHPNLMSVIDHGESEGVPYLVMEYHPGVSLKDALARGALEPRRAVFIAYQILAGLGSAHENGVVHRDLKPDNVLLVGAPGEDLVKILDFGVAKLLDLGSGPTEVSAIAGAVLGTPEYMAPEQARMQPVDARTDLYAVGIILYEMVVGRRPFEGDNDLAVLRQQVEDAAVPPRALRTEISRELDGVITRAIAKDPDQRWPSAQAFQAALAELPEGSGVLLLRRRARRPSAPARASRRAERGGRRRLAVLSALLLATVAGTALAASYGLVDVPRLPWSDPGDPAPPPGHPERRAREASPESKDASPESKDASPESKDAAPPPMHDELQPYVAALRAHDTAPVDYILGVFADHDVVVLCARPIPETTQYELVSRLVADPRFVDGVGHVFTDVGSGIVLPSDGRVELVPFEPPSDGGGRAAAEPIIAAVRQGGFKALVIATPPHAFHAFPRGDAGDYLGRYLHEAFPGKVANVLLHQLGPGDAPIAGGRWDAAFAVAGDPQLGFDLAATPFGRDPFDLSPPRRDDARYEEMFAGFVFYEPLAAHRLITDAGTGSYADRAPEAWAAAQQRIARWLTPDAPADASPP